MPSVRSRARVIATAALAALAAGSLAGCTTTQHEAQRVQLDGARERAAVLVTKVTSVSRTVRAAALATVAAGGQTAFVVTVVNSGRKGVSDLPISVGYVLAGHARVYLNDTAGLGYFETHLPAVFPRRPKLWILTVSRSLPAGARPFALIGPKPTVAAQLTESVSIAARYRYSAGTLRIRLDNATSVPQYQLQLYAYARKEGRYLAAVNRTITDLGAGSTQRLTLRLVGNPQGARVALEIAPTILQ